jgi:V8-like Glu-specific endopeptidase
MTYRTAEFVRLERQEEIIAYWTPERMRAAEPIDAGAAAAAPPTALPPGRPLVPRAYQTTLINYPDRMPYCRPTGKLFFTDFRGVNRAGSASAIHPCGILTAAHCVYDWDNQAFMRNVAFAPAYQDGNAPYNIWPTVIQPFVNAGYRREKNFGDDYAFCRIPPLGGQLLGHKVGHYWLIVNRPDFRLWDTLGYPGEFRPGYPFDGDSMWSCVGPITVMDDTSKIGKEGNLTRGASGGPWLVPGTAYVNGVESYGYESRPDLNFSPYFDDEVLALYYQAFPA